MSATPVDVSSAPPFSLSTPIILGSSSKWRAKVLRSMRLTIVRQMNPDIDEYAVRVSTEDATQPRHRSKPEELSIAVARAKAKHLLDSIPTTDPPHLLITSDQVAFFDGDIREKPIDAAQCRRWFAQYAEKPIQVCNGVVVTDTRTREEFAGTVIAAQLFAPVPSDILDAVIETGDILGCCGGFIVDDHRITPYLRTRVGTEDEIIGLPKALLIKLLQQADAAAAARTRETQP